MALEAYKEDRKPVFKSSPSQFMTVIYSVDYKDAGKVTKLSLSIPMIDELLIKMTEPMSAKDMRDFCDQKDATYFKTHVIDPLITEGIVAMTHPDSPKSPTQKYYLTDFGKSMFDKKEK